MKFGRQKKTLLLLVFVVVLLAGFASTRLTVYNGEYMACSFLPTTADVNLGDSVTFSTSVTQIKELPQAGYSYIFVCQVYIDGVQMENYNSGVSGIVCTGQSGDYPNGQFTLQFNVAGTHKIDFCFVILGAGGFFTVEQFIAQSTVNVGSAPNVTPSPTPQHTLSPTPTVNPSTYPTGYPTSWPSSTQSNPFTTQLPMIAGVSSSILIGLFFVLKLRRRNK